MKHIAMNQIIDEITSNPIWEGWEPELKQLALIRQLPPEVQSVLKSNGKPLLDVLKETVKRMK